MNKRKKEILEKIIEVFLKTAEPVGSQLLACKYFQNLSSASLRREMSQLEEMGYLSHPHTSAGRVPTTFGYRFYVNSCMEKAELSLKEKKIISDKLKYTKQNIENILEEVANVLTGATKCPAVAFVSNIRNIKLIFFDLIFVDNFNVLIITVDNNQVVYKKNIKFNYVIDIKVLRKITQVLQKILLNLTFEEIKNLNNDFLEKEIYASTGFVPALIKHIVKESLSLEFSNKVHIQGKNIIFSFPEFQSTAKILPLLKFLEDENFLINIIKQSFPQLRIKEEQEPIIKIIIGEENPYKEMQDCSFIFSAQQAMNFLVSFAVIGPKRMPYAKAISALQFIGNNLYANFLGGVN